MKSKPHSNASECREYSRNSRDSGKLTDVETPEKLVKRTLIREMHLQHSECRELSPNSRVVTEASEGRHQHTKPVCVGEPSEYSRDLLGVCNNVSVPSFSWLKSMSQIVGLTATWQDKVEGNPTGANTAGNAKVNISPVHTEFNFFL